MTIPNPCLCGLLFLALPLMGARAEAGKPLDYKTHIEPILVEYCYDCHGDGADKGDFTLDAFTDLQAHLGDHPLWLSVWENVRAQIMPPAKKKQPTPAQREQLIAWISQSVFKLDPANPDPGRVTVRRLNREEYENTVRDVFGYTFNAREHFPPDDTGYGFDNVGDALTLSPLLMEKYMKAAQLLVRKLVPTMGPVIPTRKLYPAEFQDDKKRKAHSIPFDQPGVFSNSFKTKVPGTYRLTLEYRIQGADQETASTAKVAVRVKDQAVMEHFLAWGDTQTIRQVAEVRLVDDRQPIDIELKAVDAAGSGEKTLRLDVQRMTLHGPLDGSHTNLPEGYDRIFVEGAPEGKEPEAYLRSLISHWGLRLWRRPVTAKDADRLLKLAGPITGEHQEFEKGFAAVLTAMLASPKFLFRLEPQSDPDNPAAIIPVDEFALASRLSYFLWRSAPDTELLELAGKGLLREQLPKQVERMLADSRSKRFVKSFTSQWLLTGNIDQVELNPRRILGIKDSKEAERFYNYRTRAAMRDETEMLFAHIVKEDRTVLDFLVPDYTFVNEYLALTYGIDGIKGKEMRKISLPPDSPRGGILGHGSFLVVTSNPTRTSPVKRGLFVLENLLGTPAPPAPEEVPSIEQQQSKKGNQDLGMRALLELHREDKACAGCHARFDPIGLALDNFNAIGMWRDQEGGTTIDAGGELITGEAFANAKELSRILATDRRGDFYRCLTEKLLTFAIGRGIEYYDAPTIAQIVEQLEAEQGKMSTLIHGIINSAPFQKRRGDGDRFANKAL